ncbi:hypothetical protein E4V01_24490 [Methylorubrum sp. Q1]|uniref:L,D-transpeptidase family protein n=1 Tax=Methylorubrum sp. Q1 TaxID=2562453 RepID=UPI001076222B|nr:L,D-transpeptidase family protein [Methylorubrum sp. Q1]TFZ54828.1 hypothetical protein E4V01_24490 [Methylorubrum sp. Q1]
MAYFDDLIGQIDAVEADGSKSLAQVYEDELQERVLAFGNSVQSSPSRVGVADWLRLFARLSSLSVEAPAELTARLWDDHRALVEEALAGLDANSRRAVEEFLASLDDADLALSDFAFEPPADVLAGDTPVLATFTIEDSFDGSRRKVWTGRLTVSNRQGQVVGDYAATTGGFVADYRKRNGPTPPGTYKVSNHRPNRHGAPGMERDGIAYSFDLVETDGTPVFGRSALRIHPDEAPAGTHGCVGIAEGAASLRDCETKLAAALAGGAFRLRVIYGPAGVG